MNDDGPLTAANRRGHLLLQSMIDQSPAWVALCGTDGCFLLTNRAYAQSLGLLPEDLVGRREGDVLDADNAPSTLRVRANGAADTVSSASTLEELVVLGEHRYFLVNRFPVFADDGEAVANGLIATEIRPPLVGTDVAVATLQCAEEANASLRRALEQMEKLAYTDRLTGTWNRRHLEDSALVEMSRSERHGHPASLLIADIDHFKRVNDQFGHPAGDRVLRELVACIRSGVRRADTLTRWGGEEFIVLAPDTPLHEAELLAQKLCARIAATPVPGVGQITVSIGVAEYQCGEGFDAWILRADRALYQAKVEGRNRCVSDPATAFDAAGEKLVPPTLVQLVWRDSYRSGDAMVDRQHQQLFRHANRLLEAVMLGAPGEAVLAATQALLDDVLTHFRDEEALHVRIGFPGRESHALEHARLLEKARDLCDGARLEAVKPAELFQFLAYEVVAQHLLGVDRRYFPYLDGEAATLAPPSNGSPDDLFFSGESRNNSRN